MFFKLFPENKPTSYSNTVIYFSFSFELIKNWFYILKRNIQIIAHLRCIGSTVSSGFYFLSLKNFANSFFEFHSVKVRLKAYLSNIKYIIPPGDCNDDYYYEKEYQITKKNLCYPVIIIFKNTHLLLFFLFIACYN